MVVSQITSPMITSRSIPKIVLCHRSDCIFCIDAGNPIGQETLQGSGGAVCRQWPSYNGDARVSCDLRIWNIDGSEIRAITKTSCEVDSWSTILYGFFRHTRWRSPDFWTIKSPLWDRQWLTMSRTLAWKKVPPQDPASFADLSFLGDSRETLPGFFGDGDGARMFKSHGIMEWWNKITLRMVIVGNANLKSKLEQALLSLLRISINFDWIHKTVSNRDS